MEYFLIGWVAGFTIGGLGWYLQAKQTKQANKTIDRAIEKLRATDFRVNTYQGGMK